MLLLPPAPSPSYTWAQGMTEREFFNANAACEGCGGPDFRVFSLPFLPSSVRILVCQGCRWETWVEVPAWAA